ncbi:Fic family protein [Steroidobacter denitrificans]|uniref:Fic family protein n=1 Tax=Steroidobacter denitrificans TaxID=465721 RepID=A0A127FEM4_STEDE|nr:Fic family protein [Steroidobacter denitrificans]AMN48318.1 Fic family protein [Steroidobacter denitrificans]
MATPADKLAASLAVLKELQDAGRVALRASDMTRTHRERLVKAGFIKEVMKGWYISFRPDEPAGESTSWYASFWAFCASYLESRFAEDWCASPEQSISLHTGNWTVPRQLLVRSPRGNNKPTGLVHDTSIFDVRLELPPAADRDMKDGVRVYKLSAALLGCSQAQFTARPTEMRAALAMILDASDLLSRLLDGGHSTIAGRLAAAFRNIGRERIADDITGAMQAAGYTVSESDPFEDRSPVSFSARETSPYVNRMRMNWARMREDVRGIFPTAPGQPADAAAYLKQVEEIYLDDAYNSLSIEGYKVSAVLIEKVRTGNWNPGTDKGDQEHRNALAARGYWQAFQAVEQGIKKVLSSENAGRVADRDHATWYRELFGPSVTAGILRAADLAGYRNGPVYIRRSMHTPPTVEAVRELMPALFELLEREPEASVRVVLGHFMFVYIHPYMDGNGRMGRFLMNLMFASGGYPWTIVPLERRADYMSALERASVDGDIKPFAKFLAELVDVRAG